jgi:hypothetical protein
MSMDRVVRIEGNVKWEIHKAPGGNWVGICEALQLTLQAETWGGLMEDIALTLDAVFKDLLASRELDAFLKDRGWSIAGTIPSRPEDVERFDMPFFPSMMGAHGPLRELRQ